MEDKKCSWLFAHAYHEQSTPEATRVSQTAGWGEALSTQSQKLWTENSEPEAARSSPVVVAESFSPGRAQTLVVFIVAGGVVVVVVGGGAAAAAGRVNIAESAQEVCSLMHNKV